MLSFITYKSAPEQIEIVGDKLGLQALIDYLESVKNAQDHMHLIFESEINDYPISQEQQHEVVIIKHVRVEFSDTDTWNE